MKINPASQAALSRAAELLRYHNKQLEIKRIEEMLEQEKLRVKRLRPSADPDKGNNVDVAV